MEGTVRKMISDFLTIRDRASMRERVEISLLFAGTLGMADVMLYRGGIEPFGDRTGIAVGLLISAAYTSLWWRPQVGWVATVATNAVGVLVWSFLVDAVRIAVFYTVAIESHQVMP
jgi:hypothetical protein